METKCPGTDSRWHDPSLEKTPSEPHKYWGLGEAPAAPPGAPRAYESRKAASRLQPNR